MNISSQLTDKFRVGAQVYSRNLGELGNWHPTLDWAYGDYRFKDWFGIRAGKVKTVLGLYNETQDMEFLHTWALLPQSMYPSDLRDLYISHKGGDVYGTIGLRKAGSLSYTAYAGARSNDQHGGYYYVTRASTPISSYTGIAAGGDIRWNSPVSGLMLGGSFTSQTADIAATIKGRTPLPLTVTFDPPQRITAFYGDFQRDKWHFSGEYRLNKNMLKSTMLGRTSNVDHGESGWFVSAAYRVAKRLELGTYHSRYSVDKPMIKVPAGNHINDQAMTARFDLSRFCNLKVEGHLMDGYGDYLSAHGFYAADNPAGLKPKTNLVIVRLGFNL